MKSNTPSAISANAVRKALPPVYQPRRVPKDDFDALDKQIAVEPLNQRPIPKGNRLVSAGEMVMGGLKPKHHSPERDNNENLAVPDA